MKPEKTPSKKKTPPATIVWFEIPADDPGRARAFYQKLFGWNIGPFRGLDNFWMIETGGGEDSPDGGMMVRKHPQQGITNYVKVASVSRFLVKVEKLGGKVCLPKTSVPQMGYFAICRDTEKNVFGLWENNLKAK